MTDSTPLPWPDLRNEDRWLIEEFEDDCAAGRGWIEQLLLRPGPLKAS